MSAEQERKSQMTISLDASTHVVCEIIREHRDDGYWIVFETADGRREEAGPLNTEEEADRAISNLKVTALTLGGIEIPLGAAN